jgi:hypothetical protein
MEEADADYIDVVRRAESSGMGVPALLALMNGDSAMPPFRPPFSESRRSTDRADCQHPAVPGSQARPGAGR